MTTTVPAGFVKMGNRLVRAQTNFGTPKQKTRKFLIVLQFFAGDQAAVEQLGALIADLERTRNHDADILIWGRFDAPQFSPTVIAKLEAKFGKVIFERCRRRDGVSYPFAANNMFHDLAGLLCCMPWLAEYYAFLPLEADCTPCRPGWIGELTAAFLEATKRQKFVIGFIENDPKKHVNGVAVYATDVRKRAGSALLGCGPNVCYDIAAAPVILPLAEHTPLIQFKYRQPTITPDELFMARGPAGVAPALYHGVKDGSARAAVRARHITFTDPKPIVIVHQPKPVPVLQASEIQDPTGFSTEPAEIPPLGVAETIRMEEAAGRVTHTMDSAAATVLIKPSPVTADDIAPLVAFTPSIPPNPNEIVLGQTALPVKRSNVYTYSHKHDGVTKPEMNAILAAWTKGWASRGWNPVVLTLRDAAKHPKFEAFQAAVEKLPCVGDRRRMAHRFYRWLALDTAGGGLMTDWDVLPVVSPENMKPETSICANYAEHYGARNELLSVYFSKEESAKWVETLMKYDAQPLDLLDDKPHVSDKMIIQNMLKKVDTAVVSIGQMAHFDSIQVGNERKSVAMERFLAGK